MSGHRIKGACANHVTPRRPEEQTEGHEAWWLTCPRSLPAQRLIPARDRPPLAQSLLSADCAPGSVLLLPYNGDPTQRPSCVWGVRLVGETLQTR